MVGENLNLVRSDFVEPDSVQAAPQGERLDFGIDLSNRQSTERIQPQSVTSQATRTVLEGSSLEFASHPFSAPEIPNNQIEISDCGPIQSIALPQGWSEVAQTPPEPGAFVMQPGNTIHVADGKWFVPPACDGDKSVEMHVGPGLHPAPAGADAAFRKALASPPHDLTAQEFQALAAVIAPFDGGNNQFHDMGSLFPKFDVTGASLVDVNGRSGLLVKGIFKEGAQAGLMRESLYLGDNQNPGGLEQLDITAPPAKMQNYEVPFWNTVRTIRFAY